MLISKRIIHKILLPVHIDTYHQHIASFTDYNFTRPQQITNQYKIPIQNCTDIVLANNNITRK